MPSAPVGPDPNNQYTNYSGPYGRLKIGASWLKIAGKYLRIGPPPVGSNLLFLFAERNTPATQYLVKWDGSTWSLVASGTDLFLGGDASLDYFPMSVPEANYAVKLGANHYIAYDSALMRSTDGGLTWAKVLALTSTTTLEAITVCRTPDGTVYALMPFYTASGNDISEVWRSLDEGATFALLAAEDINVPLVDITASPGNDFAAVGMLNAIPVIDQLRVRMLAGSADTTASHRISSFPDVPPGTMRALFSDTGRLVIVIELFDPAPGSHSYLRVFYTDTPPTGFTEVALADSATIGYLSGSLFGGLCGTSTAMFFSNKQTDEANNRVYMSNDNAVTWAQIASPGMELSALFYDSAGDILYCVEGGNTGTVGGNIVKRMTLASTGAGAWEDISAGLLTAIGGTLPLTFLQQAIMFE